MSSSEPGGSSPRPLSIVYLTVGLYSYLHRTFPLAREAVARGHRFTVVSDHRPAIDYTVAQGLDAVLLEQQEAAWAATLPAPYWPRGGRVLAKIPGVGLGPRGAARRTWALRRDAMLDTGELLDVLDRLGADLVVTEIEQHRDIRVVLGAGIPLALVDDHYGTRPSPGAPHPGSAYQPSGSRWSRLRTRLGWELLFLGARTRARAERQWLAGNDPTSVLAELAEQAGLNPRGIGTRTAVLHDYDDVPTIRPLAELLFYPTDDRSGIITGPVVDDERHDPLVDPEFAPAWARIVERRRADPAHRIVALAFGTLLREQDRLVESVVVALGGRADVDVVLAVGEDLARWAGRDTAGNLHFFARVPQLDVLAEADAVIGAGGPATVHEAIWHGVPQVLVSGGGVAQDGLVARTDAAGMGIRIDPRDVDAKRIRSAIDRVLVDDVMRARVTRAGEELRARQGTSRTVDALEGLAE